MRALALASAALALVACGARSPANDPIATPAPERGWLVWSEARTTWIDSDGEAHAERPGLVMAAGTSLVAIERERETIVLPTCDQLEQDDTGAPGGDQGTRTRLVAVEVATGARRVLLEALDAEGLASLEHDLVPVASLGPWLFVRERAERFACGAHGDVEVAMRVIDVRTGSRAELELGPTSDLRARARDALLAEGEGAIETPLELEDVEPVASVPVFDAGHVVMDHVFVAEACYACGDGEWSSYTRATTIRDPRVPAAIAEDAALPEPVARWIAAHPGARGMSVAPASRLSLFAGQGGADASAAVDGEDATASAEATGDPGAASASSW
ncbi:hypothetical protein [Sandaracinus amylolyticus]|uniref:hypothetical protein n=1 Tax=Sandaracinus amylolyticus TaxID=927083 RepID=UPI001F462051|nr:hypothetical protein [Sandaracinus amylolyticus]UJR79531.1 Hypothetical protein I5071_15670 [Sandaracinus amylolyticus]